MGCWNKTCGLSNLHIRAGEEVYVFVLEKRDYYDICYSTAFYKPLLLPFYSEYNDYGAGENDHGVALNLIMDGIKKVLIERDIGENEYHDIAVKREDFDIELFYEAVHENRLQKKSSYKHIEVDIEFVMFRKDIVDDILANWEQEHYVGDGKGTGGWGNNYITYKFADVVADIPALLDELTEKIKGTKSAKEYIAQLKQSDEPDVKDFIDTAGDDEELEYFFTRNIAELVEWNSPNKASWYARNDSHRYSRIVAISDEILQRLRTGKRKEAEELMVEYIKANFIDAFMHATRKVWIPGAHEGSQAQELSGYRALIGAMSRAIDAEQAEIDENNASND